jgi:DNA-binding NarL/FixJ family response regulator
LSGSEEYMSRIRVLVADDNMPMLDAVVETLKPEFDVVGTVSDGHSLILAVELLGPDVLILDISMPILNGIDAARLLKESGTSAKIVFLTVHEDRDFVRDSLAAGALGYVIKPRFQTDLPMAIREAIAGRVFISPTIPELD